MFKLPELTKTIPDVSHFPTEWQAVVFRAAEFYPCDKIARLLHTSTEIIREAKAALGLPSREPSPLWVKRGYISIIRSLWHLLPYCQLCELLEIDEGRLAALLREEDFLDVKLGKKPNVDKVYYRPLEREETEATKRIEKAVKGLLDGGKQPFAFVYIVERNIKSTELPLGALYLTRVGVNRYIRVRERRDKGRLPLPR